jgi:hypothetical protein
MAYHHVCNNGLVSLWDFVNIIHCLPRLDDTLLLIPSTCGQSCPPKSTRRQPQFIHHISSTHKTQSVRDIGNWFALFERTPHQVQYISM